ncbi:MAG: efflux transporter outer membrane subunit [Verrucomicrobiae bacterium]|nr:efflux transporter outer membrane subunit [Verrucomicrobiae bacterium]
MAGALTAASAAVGPDYQRPETPAPAAYKASEWGDWKPGEPMDHLGRGPWWELFNDPELDRLAVLAAGSNQELRAAMATVEQARAAARIARADLLPAVDAQPGFRRERFSPNQEPDFGAITANTFRVPLDLSYELDLWGRVRRGFESARAEAASRQAALHTVLLTLQADVAQNYFRLRALDAEIAVVRRTLDLRREQVGIVDGRLEAGLGPELDVARARTELAVAEVERAALERQRGELENALAILTGQPPPAFRLAPRPDPLGEAEPEPPLVPAGLPSALLERRPDIAEAERQLAADNARIGIARAAFFPVVRLTGSGGFLSADVESLFQWESRVWSIGPSVSLPLFAGGRHRAGLRQSKARFEESVARYRQRILVAFGEVEDALAALRHLAVQADAQSEALAQSLRARDLAQAGFTTGLTDFLSVIDADREALRNERAIRQIAGQRRIAAVQLIKALGGGWENGPDKVPRDPVAVRP